MEKNIYYGLLWVCDDGHKVYMYNKKNKGVGKMIKRMDNVKKISYKTAVKHFGKRFSKNRCCVMVKNTITGKVTCKALYKGRNRVKK